MVPRAPAEVGGTVSNLLFVYWQTIAAAITPIACAWMLMMMHAGLRNCLSVHGCLGRHFCRFHTVQRNGVLVSVLQAACVCLCLLFIFPLFFTAILLLSKCNLLRCRTLSCVAVGKLYVNCNFIYELIGI